jgi:hypothetical protein
MTAERAEAYGRIMRALRAYFGRAPRNEITRLREACDTLVLASAPSSCDGEAMTEAFGVLADLVARGGISRELAAAVVDDIDRCAPPDPEAGRIGGRA